MCIDDSTTMRMATSPVTDSTTVTGCVAFPSFGRIVERTLDLERDSQFIQKRASTSPSKGHDDTDIVSSAGARGYSIPSQQLICFTSEQLDHFANLIADQAVQRTIKVLDPLIDKSISRHLRPIMRSAVRSINGTNAKGPTSKDRRKQVQEVINTAAAKNTSLLNACKIVFRDFKRKDGYKSAMSLYCYCHDHEADIEIKIRSKNPNWNRKE